MDILKYYRKRKIELPEKQSKLGLPDSYLDFAMNYNPVDIVRLITKSPYLLGFKINDKIIIIRFVELNCLSKYELRFEDGIYTEPLVLIAGNNIPEGGIYLDLETGKIYNLEDELNRVEKEERELIAESFDQFLENLSLFELSNQDPEYCEKVDLEVPGNIDDLKYRWEN